MMSSFWGRVGVSPNMTKDDWGEGGQPKDDSKGRNLHFSLKTVSESQVVKAIKALKNKTSSGSDFVSPKILKSTVDIIMLS